MGGNAIRNTSPLSGSLASEIIEKKISTFRFLNDYKLIPTGSTINKSPDIMIGDIDLLVEIPHQKVKETRYNILENLANQSCITDIDSIGSNIISFGIKYLDKIHQVDLILTNNLYFSQWMYFSPRSNISKWRGLYRNSLLAALCHYKDVEFNVKDKTFTRYCLSFDSGLHRVTYRVSDVKGNRLIKTPTEVSREFITDCPDEICFKLLGYAASAHLMTYEHVIELVKEMEEQNWILLEKVIDHHIEDIKRKPGDLEIPDKSIFSDYIV